MKKIIAAVIAIAVAFFSSCGINDNGATTVPESKGLPNISNKKTVVFIETGESGSFWEAVERGANDAAKKFNCSVVFKGNGKNTLLTYEAQKAYVEETIKSKADALILSTVESGFYEVLTEAYDYKIPVIQFESGVSEEDINQLEDLEKNPIVSTVIGDEKSAGKLTAEKLFEKIKKEIELSDENYKIGIVYNEKIRSASQRVEGFIEKFAELSEADEKTKNKFTIEKRASTNGYFDDNLQELCENGVKAIFLAGEAVVNEATDEIYKNKEQYKNVIFFGFDSGSKQLKLLEENDNLIGSVARDAYNMGYNAVEQAISATEGKEVKPIIEIGNHWYDKGNFQKMIQDNIVFEG